ncbi:MAG: type II toxin-antitoxin system HigB family toxin [Rhodocyclaceae bacterium]|nr:type II toxin-antitoxin system HigB family toxin [Rhodocyclaceae bacterium]
MTEQKPFNAANAQPPYKGICLIFPFWEHILSAIISRFPMRILGLPLLQRFKQSHADARGPIDAWQDEVERSQWQTSQDIKQRYSSADFLADNRVIFNVKGNRYRLVVQVRYLGGLVVVEWIGTHAEYNQKKF